MQLNFKSILGKWELLDDRINYENKSIFFEDIHSIKYSKPGYILPGIITIKINNTKIDLFISKKFKENGEKALRYLQENCKKINQNFSDKDQNNIESKIDPLLCGDVCEIEKETIEFNNEDETEIYTNCLDGLPSVEEYIDSFKNLEVYDNDKILDEKFIKKITRNKTVEYENFIKYPNTTKRPYCFVVLDFETTGLDPINDEIIEIGAIKFEFYEPIEIFKTYIKPNQKVSKKITNLSGITNDMLEKAPNIENMLPKLLDFIGDNYIVAHNAPFDMAFLLNNLYKYNFKRPKNKAIDTLKLARTKVREYDWDTDRSKKLKSYSLKNLKQEMGFWMLNSHEALDDCKVCAYLYMKIIERYEDFCYLY